VIFEWTGWCKSTRVLVYSSSVLEYSSIDKLNTLSCEIFWYHDNDSVYSSTGVLEYCTRVLISTQVLEYCTRVLEYQVLEYSSIWVDYRYVYVYNIIIIDIAISIDIIIAIVLEYRYSTRVQYSSTRVPVSISSIRSPVRYFYRYHDNDSVYSSTRVLEYCNRLLEYSSTQVSE
jgi:hypothetical protein